MGVKALEGAAAHDVSRLPGQWNTATFPVARVRVALYTSGAEVAFLRFSGSGTDRSNWFRAATRLASPWTDIIAAGQNFFQIPKGRETTGVTGS